MPHTMTASQWVPFPIELVFAFFANPSNLPHLMPGGQKSRIESSRIVAPPPRPLAADPALRFQSPAAGAGSEIVLSFRPVPFLPFRMEWLARISEFEWYDHFRDDQLRGPFATWSHTHHLASETRKDESGTLVAGTLITDRVEYTVPLGPLGLIANALFVRYQLKGLFAYRQRRVDEILPVAARQAVQRS